MNSNLRIKIPHTLKQWALGVTIPVEYPCMAYHPRGDHPAIYLSGNGSDDKLDVTHTHLFLGYKPLVIGFPVSNSHLDNFSKITHSNPHLIFSHPGQAQPFARLKLFFTDKMILQDQTVFFFSGKKGDHHLIHKYYQAIWYLKETLKRPIPGNIDLPGNLYDQVRIAYSFPRIISLVTVGEKNSFNLFPTDLNGNAGDSHYLISLRYNGKACAQTKHIGKLVISTVLPDFFKQAYALGKNHMKDLRSASEFPFGQYFSGHYQLPLPQSVVSWKELEYITATQIGIHQIQTFRVTDQQSVLSESTAVLAHIHAFYAQWRKNHGLSAEYLLR